jgi:hypothetical protein
LYSISTEGKTPVTIFFIFILSYALSISAT